MSTVRVIDLNHYGYTTQTVTPTTDLRLKCSSRERLTETQTTGQSTGDRKTLEEMT